MKHSVRRVVSSRIPPAPNQRPGGGVAPKAPPPGMKSDALPANAPIGDPKVILPANAPIGDPKVMARKAEVDIATALLDTFGELDNSFIDGSRDEELREAMTTKERLAHDLRESLLEERRQNPNHGANVRRPNEQFDTSRGESSPASPDAPAVPEDENQMFFSFKVTPEVVMREIDSMLVKQDGIMKRLDNIEKKYDTIISLLEKLDGKAIIIAEHTPDDKEVTIIPLKDQSFTQ